MDNTTEPKYVDSRKLNKDDNFNLDTNYYMNQLEKDLAETQRQLRMQRAGFDQLQDQYNQRIDSIVSLEDELEKTRGQIGEHESLAVRQQMIVDDFTEFKKLLEHRGTDFDGLLEDLRKTNPNTAGPMPLRDQDPTNQLDRPLVRNDAPVYDLPTAELHIHDEPNE